MILERAAQGFEFPMGTGVACRQVTDRTYPIFETTPALRRRCCVTTPPPSGAVTRGGLDFRSFTELFQNRVHHEFFAVPIVEVAKVIFFDFF